MALEEIEKLRARVEKDPSSRLFLPLAEEYRKSGMADEAIKVILKGLERHPGYTSARVALGRLYLEKNMLEEAKAEFEQVINTVPDNLFAHRKLADIYRELDDIERAVAEYRTVIHLNPLDEEAKACLENIESSSAEVLPVEEEPAEISAETAEEPPRPAGGVFIEEEPVAEVPGTETSALDAFEEFSRTFSQEMLGETVIEQPAEAQEEPAGETAGFVVESPFGELLEERSAPAPATGPETKVPAGFAEIDALILQGRHYQVVEAYRQLLAADPGNRQVLQRVAEFKAYLKMIGKGEEVFISKLESFLAAVKQHFGERNA